MEIINKKINDINPYEKNPRRNDEAVKYVAESIKSFGFKVPIIIDSNGVIVAGHTRYKAAKKLKLKDVPCIIADDLTDDQVKAFRLADNKVAEKAEWDFDLLSEELNNIFDFDMSDFGFENEEFKTAEEEESEAVEDDYIEDDIISEPKAKQGDIYQLGRHRLMCGDSTSVANIKKLIGDNEIDLVLTDPPYGINIVQNNSVGGDAETKFGPVGGGKIVKTNTYMAIKGDNTTDTARDFYKACCDMGFENLILFGGNYFTDFLKPSMCWIVWDKENTGNFADVELAWTSFDRAAKLYRWLWNGMSRKGERNVEGKTRVHPTQKPVGMLGEILKDFSTENQNIFDGFGGSGSTLIACEQLNRACFMIEYEPHYIDVIINRWEQFTGEKAVLIGEDS